MSPVTVDKNKQEDPRLLRRLAALVAQCRSDAEDGAPGGVEIQLANVLFLFALKLVEQWHLQDLVSAPANTDLLSAGATALHKHWRKFAPATECLPLPAPDPLVLATIWRGLDADDLLPLWSNSCLLGYVYQYFFLSERKTSQRLIQTANKEVNRQQIIAFTQLYTPSWVAEFLLDQTLSPAMASPAVPDRKNQPIAVLDPACGAGHFLIPAFDVLSAHYVNAGMPQARAAQQALAGLHGADIDAASLSALSLSLLLRYAQTTGAFPERCWHNIANVSDHLLGSLGRNFASSHILARKYSAVVTNPPYIGRKLLSREMKQALKKEYPTACSDLCAPFVVRGLEWLENHGRLGLITQSSILSLPSYTELRRSLVSDSSLICAVELGSGVFPLQGGEKVNSVLLVAQADRHDSNSQLTVFRDLSASADKAGDLDKASHFSPIADKQKTYLRDSSVFLRLANVPFHYRAPSFLFDTLMSCRPLSDKVDVRQGLATTDNDRFVKYWWEVDRGEIGNLWFPYVKGAGTQRWSSPILNVVNFAEEGREIKQAVTEKYPYLRGKSAWVVKNEQYYFRPGLCFSFVSTEQFAVRVLPAGSIFDVGASAIFCDDDEKFALLGYLNCTLMRALCKLYNPTINVQVGDVKRLPLFTYDRSVKEAIGQAAAECTSAKELLGEFFAPGLAGCCPLREAMTDFGRAPAESCAQLINVLSDAQRKIASLEMEIDSLVLKESFELKKLSGKERTDLADWLRNETDGYRRDKQSLASSPIQPVDVADRLLLMLMLEMQPVKAVSAGSARVTVPVAHGGKSMNRSFGMNIDSTTGSALLSRTLIDWLESVYKQSISRCITERMGLSVKQHLRKRPPADWPDRLKTLCEHASALKLTD